MTRRRARQGLFEHLGRADDLLLLTGPGMDPAEVPREWLPDASVVHELSSPVPPPREHDAVVLAVRDLVGLRRAVTGMANFGRARRVGVWFARDVAQLPVMVPSLRWPAVEDLRASRSPQPYLLVGFASSTAVRPVFVEIARAAAHSGRLAVSWPSLGLVRSDADRWPPADPSAKVAIPARVLDQAVDSPPDLVLGSLEAMEDASPPEAAHPVLGRPTLLAVVEPDLSWEELAAMSPGEAEAALTGRGVSSLGAVDEHVINPVGFTSVAAGDVQRLGANHGGQLEVSAGERGSRIVIDSSAGLSDVDLTALRDLAGVSLDWSGGHGPQAYCRAVAGLAAAGVPVVAEGVPSWARRLLAADVVDVLERSVDLRDVLRREEHSVLLRRAALRSHASGPWRRSLAAAHDLQTDPGPTVSVLLVTRRPGMLPFALRQVARQRGLGLEVVLATHGFAPGPGVLEEFRSSCSTPLTALEIDASVPFGDVLNRAAQHAGGDVLLKMDDDDWYGPDFAADLLLARGYSGADVVGCPPEITFLEPIWVTVHGATTTEVYRPFVAGGTLLVDRDTFRALGGFRRTERFVDANLLSAVASAGGRVYRTHGLGYVLRRASTGHTWDPGLEYFLDSRRVREQWRGFRPSALLEVAARDRPVQA
jgi:hypothetical protein